MLQTVQWVSVFLVLVLFTVAVIPLIRAFKLSNALRRLEEAPESERAEVAREVAALANIDEPAVPTNDWPATVSATLARKTRLNFMQWVIFDTLAILFVVVAALAFISPETLGLAAPEPQ